MGLVASMLGLLGCASKLENPGRWEEAAHDAAATVLTDGEVTARWQVDGGLGEMRNMVITATAEASTTDELNVIADEVEEAVAPAVVDLPDKGAGLRIVLTGEPGASPPPNIVRTVSLDDLAAKYGLSRGK